MASLPVMAGTGALAAATWRERESLQLGALVREASQALAMLDAGRLEELAECCQLLNRELPPPGSEGRRRLDAEAREAAGEMAVLGQVLEATRANLVVMERLRDLRLGRREYMAPRRLGWQPVEARNGDD